MKIVFTMHLATFESTGVFVRNRMSTKSRKKNLVLFRMMPPVAFNYLSIFRYTNGPFLNII